MIGAKWRFSAKQHTGRNACASRYNAGRPNDGFGINWPAAALLFVLLLAQGLIWFHPHVQGVNAAPCVREYCGVTSPDRAVICCHNSNVVHLESIPTNHSEEECQSCQLLLQLTQHEPLPANTKFESAFSQSPEHTGRFIPTLSRSIPAGRSPPLFL